MGGHLLLRARCSWSSNAYGFPTERSNVDLRSSAGHFAGSCDRFRVLFIPRARFLFTSRSKKTDRLSLLVVAGAGLWLVNSVLTCELLIRARGFGFWLLVGQILGGVTAGLLLHSGYVDEAGAF
jgi:hypothetical protein